MQAYQNCQNSQKQDAWFHYSIVQILLFIDVPDHLPASWYNNRTSHLGILIKTYIINNIKYITNLLFKKYL